MIAAMAVKQPWLIWVNKSYDTTKNFWDDHNKKKALQNCVHTLSSWGMMSPYQWLNAKEM